MARPSKTCIWAAAFVIEEPAIQGVRAQHHDGRGHRHRHLERRRDHPRHSRGVPAGRDHHRSADADALVPRYFGHGRARDRRLPAQRAAGEPGGADERVPGSAASRLGAALSNRFPMCLRDDPLAYGTYVAVALGHCTECHTPLVEGMHDFSRNRTGRQQLSEHFWARVCGDFRQRDARIQRWVSANGRTRKSSSPSPTASAPTVGKCSTAWHSSTTGT